MKALSFAVLILVQHAVCAEPVKVENGLVRGTVKDGLFVYRGIPYAAPPLGDLRWRAPYPAPKWQGPRAANEFGRACMQSNPAIANLPTPSEDCLYLNIWTPAKSAKDGLPGRPPANATDQAMSEIITAYWTNFAKTVDPNGAALPNWPAYNNSKPQAIHFVAGTAQAGPVVNEEGLKTLEAHFEWRRTTGADPAAGSAPAGGIPKR